MGTIRRGRALPAVMLALVGLRFSAALGDTTATWISETSSDWTDTSAWSTSPNIPNNGTPSGVNYEALINATGGTAYTVTLDSNVDVDAVTIDSADATLNQSSGTFQAGSINLDGGSYQLAGGTIANSSINLNGGSFSVQNGTLSGASISGGDLQVNGSLYVQNGLTIANQNLDVPTGGSIYFDGPAQSIDKLNITGFESIFPSGPNSVGPQTLTLGANVTVHGGAQFLNNNAGDSLINNGTLIADASFMTVNVDNFTNNNLAESSGGALEIRSANWSNGSTGVLSADAGFIQLEGNWSNAGQVKATNGSAIELNGSFTTAGIGNFSADATSTVDITGVLTNTSATLSLTSPGAVVLTANPSLAMTGTIVGGTIDNSAGNFSVIRGVLDDVSVTGGDLQVRTSGVLYVQDGLTIANHNLDIGEGGSVSFYSATGIVNLDNLNITGLGASGIDSNIQVGAVPFSLFSPTNIATTLTLGTNVTIKGVTEIDGGSPSDPKTLLINNGILDGDGAGGLSLQINVINNNIAEATNGGALAFQQGWSNAGIIKALNGSSVFLGGNVTTATLGNVFADATSTINFSGSIANTGTTLTYGGSGEFVFSGGTITGGTIDNSPGNFVVQSGTLNGVAVTGGDLKFDPMGGAGSLIIQNGLKIADHNLVLNGNVFFDGPSQTIDHLNIIGGTVNTSGPDTVGSKTLTLGGDVYAHGGVSFSGDTLINNGIISADLALSPIQVFEGAVVSTISVASFTNNNILEVTNGSGLSVLSGQFVNHGTTALHNGFLNLDQRFSPFTPLLVGQLDVGDGTLTGFGTIDGDVTLEADPSTLAFNLGGEIQGTEYDSLTINGTTVLAGNLDISLTNDFLPLNTDIFMVLEVDASDTLSGAFSNVTDGGRLETTDGAGSFEVVYGSGDFANEIVLEDFEPSVPEPAGIALIGAGLLGLLGRRRRGGIIGV